MSDSKCPVMHTTARSNRDWWPNQLNLQVLHQHSTLSNPMGEAFDYAKEFKSLDLNAVIKDLRALMTDSQEWWPADFGHYARCQFGAKIGLKCPKTLDRTWVFPTCFHAGSRAAAGHLASTSWRWSNWRPRARARC